MPRDGWTVARDMAVRGAVRTLRPSPAPEPLAAPARAVALLTGIAAALEEYADFKAAGMEAAWRERWRHILKYG